MLSFLLPDAACFNGAPYRKRPFALVCPSCLDLWAVCHDGATTSFVVNPDDCPKCAFSEGWEPAAKWRTPGSVLEPLMRWLDQEEFESSLNVLREVLDSLPADVIRSEFQTALKAFDYYKEPSYFT